MRKSCPDPPSSTETSAGTWESLVLTTQNIQVGWLAAQTSCIHHPHPGRQTRQPQLSTTQHNFGPSFCATRTMPCHRTLLPSGSNWKYGGREVGCGLWCRVERYLPGKQREPCRTDCGSTTRRHTGDTKLDRSFEHSVIPFILLRICSVCSC